MLLRITHRTAIQLRHGDRLLDVFQARTGRLALYSVTILFLEIGLLRSRDWG